MDCSCGARMTCAFTVPVGNHSRYRWYICKCKDEQQEMLDVPIEALLSGKVSVDRAVVLAMEGREKRRAGRRAGYVKKGGQ